MFVRSLQNAYTKNQQISKVPMANGARNRVFRFASGGNEVHFSIEGTKPLRNGMAWATLNDKYNKALNIAETVNMYLEESNAALRLGKFGSTARRPLSQDNKVYLTYFWWRTS